MMVDSHMSGRPPSPFVGAVKSSLEALLTDLQNTTEVLRRGQARSDDEPEPVYEVQRTKTVTTNVRTGANDLEQMLDDLTVKRHANNSSRPTVENLIGQLDSVDLTNSHHREPSVHERSRTPESTSKALDSVMNSLTSFQVRGPSAHAQRPDQIDSLMGHLESDVSKHGIATYPKGECAACQKSIVGQVVIALGKMFHPEHFLCAHCGDELGHRNFFERAGRAYCETDYHNLFSPRCAYCNGPIKDKCITGLERTWHPEHFMCANCGKQFGEEGFHEHSERAYCRQCYFTMFAPKCRGCDRPIQHNYITALSVHWHPECFVCHDCKRPFAGGSFFDHEGQPYCETHYHEKRGSLCATCHRPIAGRCVTAMAKKFHPEHFQCAFCLRQLNKGTFKEHERKPYCHDCFKKLLS